MKIIKLLMGLFIVAGNYILASDSVPMEGVERTMTDEEIAQATALDVQKYQDKVRRLDLIHTINKLKAGEKKMTFEAFWQTVKGSGSKLDENRARDFYEECVEAGRIHLEKLTLEKIERIRANVETVTEEEFEKIIAAKEKIPQDIISRLSLAQLYQVINRTSLEISLQECLKAAMRTPEWHKDALATQENVKKTYDSCCGVRNYHKKRKKCSSRNQAKKSSVIDDYQHPLLLCSEDGSQKPKRQPRDIPPLLVKNYIVSSNNVFMGTAIQKTIRKDKFPSREKRFLMEHSMQKIRLLVSLLQKPQSS